MIPRDTERPGTIALQWDGKYDEGRASVAGIKPGMLIEIVAGEDNIQQLPPTVQVHSTSGGRAAVRIALEDRLGNSAGNIEGRTIEDAYDEDDIIPHCIGLRGDVFQVRVLQHANHAVGTKLMSNGAGAFIPVTSTNYALVEVAEYIDFGAEDASNTAPLLRVVVL